MYLLRLYSKIIIALIFGLSCAFTQSALSPTAEDVVKLARPGNLEISPDGTTLLFTLKKHLEDSARSTGNSGWKTEQQLYLIPVTGVTPRQITFGSTVFSPHWSPDNSMIAFLRNSAGRTKIHLISLKGGESNVVDTGELEPKTIQWSPDGSMLAFTAVPPLTEKESQEQDITAHVIDFDRQWRSSALYTVSLDSAFVRPVTDASYNIVQFDWSPDASQFAVVTSASSDPYIAYTMNEPLIISASNGAIIRSLEAAPRVIGAIQWSPDGRFIAFETTDNSPSVYRFLRVHRADSLIVTNAAAALDPTIFGFSWSRDSQSLIAHVYEKTFSKLYRLPIDGASATDLGLAGRVLSGPISQADGDSLVAFLSSNFREPNALTILNISTLKDSVIYQPNLQVADWNQGTQEIIRWVNPEGMEIEGLLYITPHSVPDKPPPLMVYPHGGPDGTSTSGFSSWVTYFANQGYSVFRPNYRGGIAYGYDFYAANRGRLGEIEELDIESGVYHLIAAKKADPEKLVIGGWSWGGYLTSWIIGHTDRYKAAVVGAGVIDVCDFRY